MALPVQKVRMPSSLSAFTNGRIPSTDLTEVHPRGKLHVQAARGWGALVYDASLQGLPMTFTYGGMYRSYAEQEALFLRRYDRGYNSSSRSNKYWNGSWWHLVTGAIAATPGKSNHGWGLAIDTAAGTDPSNAVYIRSHPQWPWLLANAINYGFSWEIQSEPWHIRYVIGDLITPRIKAWEDAGSPGMSNPPVPPPTPTPPPTGGNQVIVEPVTIRQGSTGGWVKKLQAVCPQFNQDVGSVDGQFGPRTHAGVMNIQSFFKLTVDGIVGPKTWTVILGVAP